MRTKKTPEVLFFKRQNGICLMNGYHQSVIKSNGYPNQTFSGSPKSPMIKSDNLAYAVLPQTRA